MMYSRPDNTIPRKADTILPENAGQAADVKYAVWRDVVGQISNAETIWSVQLSPLWYTNVNWMRVRDSIDIEMFRAAMHRNQILTYRRIIPYQLKSDLGGVSEKFIRAKAEHESWLSRIQRQLAALGAPGTGVPAHAATVDYLATLALLPRTGQRAVVDLRDGIWLDDSPPVEVVEAWKTGGCIPLDPHEENIVGPYADRNPLWAGTAG